MGIAKLQYTNSYKLLTKYIRAWTALDEANLSCGTFTFPFPIPKNFSLYNATNRTHVILRPLKPYFQVTLDAFCFLYHRVAKHTVLNHPLQYIVSPLYVGWNYSKYDSILGHPASSPSSKYLISSFCHAPSESILIEKHFGANRTSSLHILNRYPTKLSS